VIGAALRVHCPTAVAFLRLFLRCLLHGAARCGPTQDRRRRRPDASNVGSETRLARGSSVPTVRAPHHERLESCEVALPPRRATGWDVRAAASRASWSVPRSTTGAERVNWAPLPHRLDPTRAQATHHEGLEAGVSAPGTMAGGTPARRVRIVPVQNALVWDFQTGLEGSMMLLQLLTFPTKRLLPSPRGGAACAGPYLILARRAFWQTQFHSGFEPCVVRMAPRSHPNARSHGERLEFPRAAWLALHESVLRPGGNGMRGAPRLVRSPTCLRPRRPTTSICRPARSPAQNRVCLPAACGPVAVRSSATDMPEANG
jgi:hypothetical protein